MAEQIPVTPQLMTWARERAGLSVDAIGKKFSNFAKWESGEAFPTYVQLEAVAEALKVPIAVFFFPEPPNVPPIGETFRTLPDREYDRLPSRIRLLLRKAKALQLNLAELLNGRNPAPRLITRDLQFGTNIAIAEMARIVRDYIGVSIETQRQWSSDDVAMKEWRAALQQVGVFIFKDAFQEEEFSGFCLYDEIFPIIYVNNSSTKTRQIFTYFHELAHLIFHTSGVDTLHDSYIESLEGDAERVEILCNKFAAEFLLPEAIFNEVTKQLVSSVDVAERIAAQFHVSREVVFRKFLDQGRIGQAEYREAVDTWNAQRRQGGAGGDYYWNKLAYLGRDYVAWALAAFHQNRIDESQLAEYLDTKPKNLSKLENYFERGSV